MTKKDYELIASVIHDLYMGHEDWQRSGNQVAEKFALALTANNYRFDPAKFYKACGLPLDD